MDVGIQSGKMINLSLHLERLYLKTWLSCFYPMARLDLEILKARREQCFLLILNMYSMKKQDIIVGN